MRYLSPIDTHVHFRGEEYKTHTYNEMSFMELGFWDAVDVGLIAVIDMPNPTPNLTTQKIIDKRIEFADLHNPRVNNLNYAVHAGLTNDLNQVRTIATFVQHSRETGIEVVALKEFFAHSTGDMGITDPEQQKAIWRELVSAGYTGPLVGHLEAEDKYTGEFDYRNPISHSLRQNPESELIQAERQIRNARDAGFRGTFVSAHTSNPNTIDYVISERAKLPFAVAVEMSWHHMLLNTNDYAIHGNRVKMNPPLRNPEMQERNLEQVLRGNVTMIGTDHAPHPLEKKDSENPPSGIPTIPAWPLGIAMLRKHKINEELLQKITFYNANEIFFSGLLKPRMVEIEYNPELWDAYGWNPFSRIGKEAGII
ncbi:MAG: hypothetical protein AABX28_03320 [Nanoarchaeota archaeon]